MPRTVSKHLSGRLRTVHSQAKAIHQSAALPSERDFGLAGSRFSCLTRAMPQRKPQRCVSQAAIAIKAGLAASTVSLALRGGQGLTPQTIKRVTDAADQLGYESNKLVHALRSGRTRIIGVMVPLYDSYWTDVVRGIHDTLIERDYVSMALWERYHGSTNSEEENIAQFRRLLQWRADGAILSPSFGLAYQKSVTQLTQLAQRNLPFTTIDFHLPEPFKADTVLSDEIMGAELIASHLYHLGHRKILHLAGSDDLQWSRDRRETFEHAIKKFPGMILKVIKLPIDERSSWNIQQHLVESPEITAVYAVTDSIAVETIQAASKLGLAVPADLSVIGFGNLELGAYLTPPLSTVKQRPYRIGCKSAELLLDRIEGKRDYKDVQLVRLPVDLIERATTSRPSATG